MNYCQFRNETIKRMAQAGGATPILPPEYQQVEYLESSGAQQINTDIDPSNDNVIECKIYTYALNKSFIYGSTLHGWCTNTLGWNSGASKVQYLTTSKTYQFTNMGDLYIIASKDSVTVNNVSITSYSDSAGASGKFCMFSCYQRVNTPGRQYGTFRMYSLTINNGGNTLGNFIPCYRKSDNKPGMFDLVTNTFFTNAGTGADFTVGNNV